MEKSEKPKDNALPPTEDDDDDDEVVMVAVVSGGKSTPASASAPATLPQSSPTLVPLGPEAGAEVQVKEQAARLAQLEQQNGTEVVCPALCPMPISQTCPPVLQLVL